MLDSRLVLVVALLFGVVGCSSDPCGSDSDCARSEICQGGACVAACDDHDDCTDGRVCDRGICIGSARCGTVADCPFGFVCEDALCIPQAAECEVDSHCPPEFRCCGGACYQPGIPAPACDAPCASDRDCDVGERCDNGGCVVTAVDAGQDISRDAPDRDAGPDTTGDAEPDIEPDVGPDADPDTAPDSEPDTPTDECEGRADGQLGERCVGADDCCNGLCFGNPGAGRGVCTDTCNSYRDCNPVGAGGDELFCYREPSLDEPLCAMSDYQASCGSGNDCVDRRCLVSVRGNACSYRCATTADCPSNSACGFVAFSDGETEFGEFVCVPVGASPCAGPGDCLSGTCLTDDETLVSYCSTVCNTADPGACPSPMRCTELPDGLGGTLPVCVLP